MRQLWRRWSSSDARPALFLVREMVGVPFTGRSNVDAFLNHVTDFVLAEATIQPRDSFRSLRGF